MPGYLSQVTLTELAAYITSPPQALAQPACKNGDVADAASFTLHHARQASCCAWMRSAPLPTADPPLCVSFAVQRVLLPPPEAHASKAASRATNAKAGLQHDVVLTCIPSSQWPSRS